MSDKGQEFERDTCKRLSLWVSGGARTDLFWRTALSGGRATLGARKGERHARQAGDIGAIDPEGCKLTDRFLVECKFYKDLELGLFLRGRGVLSQFWLKAIREGEEFGRTPMMIVKQNFVPAFLILPSTMVGGTLVSSVKWPKLPSCHIYDFVETVKAPFSLNLFQ